MEIIFKAATVKDILDPGSPHCLNVSPASLAQSYFCPHLQEKRLFSGFECGDCEPGEVVWLLVLNTHSPRRQGLCAAFCVPYCSPGGTGATSPGSVGTVDPGELDLAFWFRMPFLKNKG